MKHFKICNVNLENFDGCFVDNVMKTDSNNAEEYDLFESPYALLKHISESSRFHHKLVKMQMAQVDPLIECGNVSVAHFASRIRDKVVDIEHGRSEKL